MKKKFQSFSVPLGLLDYVNPIFYTVTMITLMRHLRPQMTEPYGTVFFIGAVLSIFFGFVIPTGKVIVGLGIIEFVMPVILVFLVNSGILLSGLMLLKHVCGMSPVFLIVLVLAIAVLLYLQYHKSRKFNTAAVLTGAVGYLMIYASLITLSLRKGMKLPVVLYGAAILLFLMLIGIGIKANLKDPRVHWVIEISNVTCQGLVTLATLLLFS